MKTLPLLLTALAVSAPFLTGTSWAQPDPDNGARAENPPNRNPGGNRQRMMGERIRAQLTQAGVTDRVAQDAVLAFLTSEMQQRNQLVQLGNQVNLALRTENPNEETIRASLAAYKVALDADGERRKAAQTKLQQQVDYTKNPRLEAFLLLTGAVGNGPVLMYSLDQGRRPGMANPRREGADRPGQGEQNRPNPNGAAPGTNAGAQNRPRNQTAPQGFGNTLPTAP